MDPKTNFLLLPPAESFQPVAGGSGAADVTINPSSKGQTMDGAGAALTDSSAIVLSQLKKSNAGTYQKTLQELFNPATGLTLLRVPIGATDFSKEAYTLAEKANGKNTAAMEKAFDFKKADMTLSVLMDIMKIQPRLKVVLTSWSAPGWMKSSNSLNGGSLANGMQDVYAAYLAAAVKAYGKKGVSIWALTVQNEPGFAATYPSMIVQPKEEGEIAGKIKKNLGNNKVKVFVHDHNFDTWEKAREAAQSNAKDVDGVAFHCYAGNPSLVGQLVGSLKGKEIHMTECSATVPKSGMWEGMTWWLDNLMFGLPQHGVRSIISWNLALDDKNGPTLPTATCKDCQGAITVSGGKSVTKNFVFYFSQHFAAAVNGGAARVGAKVSEAQKKCIKSDAYVAGTSVRILLENSCPQAAPLTISIGQKTGKYNAKPGLHTLIVSA